MSSPTGQSPNSTEPGVGFKANKVEEKAYDKHETGNLVLAESGLGIALVDWHALVGGVSASVYKMSYTGHNGQHCEAVVRCHGDIDYDQNAHIAADEFACVNVLHELGLSVPKPLYLGARKGVFGRPYAIYEYVAGDVLEVSEDAGALKSAIPAMAAWLAELHSVDVDKLQLKVSSGNQLLPRQALKSPVQPADEEIFETQIRELFGRCSQPSEFDNPVLLHGDYWNGNLLWQGPKLVAVIDWEDFGVGSAFADLACARLELLWALDGNEEDVAAFTQRYLQARGIDVDDNNERSLAWWDLCAVLPFANTLAVISECPSPTGAERLKMRRQLAGFVERAAARLGQPLSLSNTL